MPGQVSVIRERESRQIVKSHGMPQAQRRDSASVQEL